MITCFHYSPLGISGHMWSLVVPEFCLWIWNIVQVPLPAALSEPDLQRWFMSLQDFDVRSGSWPKREREGYSPLVSDPSSQCPHISACWQPFGAITCHGPTDLRVMRSLCAHWGFCVVSGGECAPTSNPTPSREGGWETGNVKLVWDVVGCYRCRGERKTIRNL